MPSVGLHPRRVLQTSTSSAPFLQPTVIVYSAAMHKVLAVDICGLPAFHVLITRGRQAGRHHTFLTVESTRVAPTSPCGLGWSS
jgi:hypothetical protein